MVTVMEIVLQHNIKQNALQNDIAWHNINYNILK